MTASQRVQSFLKRPIAKAAQAKPKWRPRILFNNTELALFRVPGVGTDLTGVVQASGLTLCQLS